MTIYTSIPIDRDGFTVVVRADRLEDDPSIHITDNLTGEEAIVPMRFFPALYWEADRAFSVVQEEQHTARYLLNHPQNYNDASLRFVGDGEQITLADSNIALAGVPMLIWVRGIDIVKQTKYPRLVILPGDPRDIPGDTDEWRLVLSGDRHTILGRASWNDAESIRALVDSLRDSEVLNVHAALVNPVSAQIRVAMQTVEFMDANRAILAMPVPVIREVINHFYPAIKSVGKNTGRIWALNVQIKNYKVAIAIGVEIPRPASRHIRTVKQVSGQYVEENLSWSETLRRDVLALNDGWHFVDLPSRDIGGFRDEDTLWITRIPEEAWITIEPLARVLAEHSVPTGKGF